MEADFSVWLVSIMRELWQLRCELGAVAASEAGPTDQGKRQTAFEYAAVQRVKARLPHRIALQAEGWEFHQSGEQEVDWIVGLDPTDGTVGDARSRKVRVLKQSLPLSLVLTVRQNIPEPTFSSVRYAGILDLRSGQMFVADDHGARTFVDGKVEELVSAEQYNDHAPTVAWEITRRALAPLRFLIPYNVYPEIYSDSNSSALVMLWSLLGYCDVWFNCELPGITGAGQRGHELGAAAVFARALSACAYQSAPRDGQISVLGALDDAAYTFDGQTSIVLGVDDRIVRHYLGLINQTLIREVRLGDQTLLVHEHLAALYAAVPGERWSLPLVQ